MRYDTRAIGTEGYARYLEDLTEDLEMERAADMEAIPVIPVQLRADPDTRSRFDPEEEAWKRLMVSAKLMACYDYLDLAKKSLEAELHGSKSWAMTYAKQAIRLYNDCFRGDEEMEELFRTMTRQVLGMDRAQDPYTAPYAMISKIDRAMRRISRMAL